MVYKNLKKNNFLNSYRDVSRSFIGSITKKGHRFKAFNVFFYVSMIFFRIYGFKDPIAFIISIIDKTRPKTGFVSKRVGAVIYKLPRYISIYKSRSIAIRWIISSAILRNSYEPFFKKLIKEIFDIYRGNVTLSIKKRNEFHNLAKSNRPFLRFLKKK